MHDGRLTVFVIDDDAAVRDSVALMLGIAGYRTSVFADAESFLQAFRPEWAGCVVADVRLPGRSGLEVQQRMQDDGVALPFIIITAHGDVSAARTAFRARAVDFLQKPFEARDLFAAVDAAFDSEARRLEAQAGNDRERRRLDVLTAREREVLQLVAEGLHAKEIARQLDISPRTVEVHKSRIMGKLGARNAAELVRIALAAAGPDGERP